MIRIDRRVGSAELLKYFPPGSAQLCELEFADFAFEGNGPKGKVQVGVERKQIRDFLDSVKTGRLLGHQVPGMLRSYDYNYLVVEGTFKAQPSYVMLPLGKRWKKINMGTKVIHPILNRLFVMDGFMVFQTCTQKQTAQLVMHLFHWWNKDFDKHGIVGPYQRPVRLPPKLCNGAMVFKVSQVLPGIGAKKALIISENFGSVVDMVNATEEDWLRIPDIGKKTAQGIREALGHVQKAGK